MHYRIRYWRTHRAEWVLTGLMTEQNARTIANRLRQSHEYVEIVFDDDGKVLPDGKE